MKAIVLGGGKLHGKPIHTSNIYKGSEMLLGMSTGERVVRALNDSGEIDNVIYCGEGVDAQNVTTIQPSSDKFFFDTVTRGMEHIGEEEIALVIAGDLPLVTGKDVKELIEKVEGKTEELVALYTTNEDIQRGYPGYNKNKRYAKFQEGDIVFANAFFVSKAVWQRVEELEKFFIKNNKPDFKGVLSYMSTKMFFDILLMLPHMGINRVSSIMSPLQKYLSPPEIARISGLIDGLLGEESKTTIIPGSPVFSIDYDRFHQKSYFESQLSPIK